MTTSTRRPKGDGEWLRAARETMGLSQEQMGLLLGVGQVAISHYETGRNQRLSKLARRELIRLLSLSQEDRVVALRAAGGEPKVVAEPPAAIQATG